MDLKKIFKLPENVPDDKIKKLQDTLVKMEDHIENRGPDFEWGLKDFDIGALLGKGKFGRVYYARDIHCHLTFALKFMHKSEIVRNHCERQVLREIEIQTHLRHPNILTLYSYFDDPRFICIVLEYASGGEMYKHMHSQPEKRFESSSAAKYLYQVVDALEYCHKKSVIHRDIKPENILLSGEDNVKLSDFGWSVHAPTSTRRTMCGTLDYLPPEMVTHESYTKSVDNWCIGVLLYEFLTGRAPFETKSTKNTYAKITQLDYTVPSYVPDNAKHLISQLLRIRASERLPLKQVKSHPWIEEHYPKSMRQAHEQ